MDHRDRAAPVALPAHAPVAQPPVHLAAADAESLQLGDHRALRRLDVQPVHEVGVEDRAGPDIGLVADGERRGVLAGRQHHRHHVQPVLAREIQVALIVPRTAEDRAGAVFHQHEVGDPHREGRVLQERVPHAQPGVVALLLRGLDHRLGRCPSGGIRRRTRRPSDHAPPPRPTADAPARAPGTTCRTTYRGAWCRPRRLRCRLPGWLPAGNVSERPRCGRSTSPASAARARASDPAYRARPAVPAHSR